MPTLELDRKELEQKLAEDRRAIAAANARRQTQRQNATRARRAIRDARRALRRIR